MSTFEPFRGYVEVEKLTDSSPLASDEKSYEEKAKVVKIGGSVIVRDLTSDYSLEVGDIIFFRPHGFFETAEHDGVKHYVVRVDSEFILGVLKNNVQEQQV